MPGPAGDGVLGMLLALVAGLRRAGVPVSMVEVLDATAALDRLDLADRPVLRAGLAATLVKRPEDEPAFHSLFDRCFRLTPPTAPRAGAANGTSPGLVEAVRTGDDDVLRRLAADAVTTHAGLELIDAGERYYAYRVLRALDVANLLAAAMRAERAEAGPAATAFDLRLRRDEQARRIERLRQLIAEEIRRRRPDTASAEGPLPEQLDDLDVLNASTTDLRAMRAAVRPLARRLARRVAQRRRRHSRGRLDVRRTVRHSLPAGGVPLDPCFRRRRASKPDVVVLCDLSGSVAEFAHFTLTLVHALSAELAGLRTFVFVDGVAEVTDLLDRTADLVEPRFLLTRPGVVTGDGHSDYGRVFDRFVTAYGEGLVTPATTLIVAGDARTNYRPAGLGAFRQLAGRARRTYWLNPEPRKDWDRLDSAIGTYAASCTGVFEVRTLRQLADAVAAIV
jgi:uncharacterized protein with von Willebrand factor type A (vWA) domain